MKSGEILCMSGGIDSITAWFYLNKPKTVHFCGDHRYSKKEENCVENLDELLDMDIIHDDSLNLGRHEYGENACITHRNLIFASVASNYGNHVYIIGVKGDRVGDKSPEAYKRMSDTLNYIKKPDAPKIKIDSCFWDMTKTDVISWLIDEIGKSMAERVYKTSVSCYDSDTFGQCGKCKCCIRKAVALKYCGIDCEDWFENDITKNPFIPVYIADMTKKDSKYDDRRTEETLSVFREWGWEC